MDKLRELLKWFEDIENKCNYLDQESELWDLYYSDEFNEFTDKLDIVELMVRKMLNKKETEALSKTI